MAIYPTERGYKVAVTKRIGDKNAKREKSFYTVDFTGKRPCKEAAENEERLFKDELRRMQEQETVPGSLKVHTFKDILDLYLKTPYKKGKNIGKPRRFNGDESRFNRLVDELGKCRPWEIACALEEKTAHWLDLDLEPSTVNRHIAIAKSAIEIAYKYRVGTGAVRKRLIPENYLEEFPLYKENNIKFRILTDEERLILWNRLGKTYLPLQKLYYHALTVPIRMSELVNIRRKHCNAISGCIVIPNTKAGPSRTIKVPEGLLQDIRHWPEGVEYLHHDLKGQPLGYWDAKEGRIAFNRYKYLRAALKGEEDEISIEGYNFHKTRQEAAMLAYQDGKPEDEIMLTGGWHTREAFYRYFNRELALQIRTKTFEIGTTWREQFPSDLKKVA